MGSLTRDPEFVDRIGRRSRAAGIGDRVHLTGPLTGADLDAAYAAADVLVLASRAETYGMVVTEALARGLPVIASAVGGVPEAVGRRGRRGDSRHPGATRRPGGPRRGPARLAVRHRSAAAAAGGGPVPTIDAVRLVGHHRHALPGAGGGGA